MCGRSACTVRREGGPNSIGPPYPYALVRGSGLPMPRRRTFEDAIVASLVGIRRLSVHVQPLAEFKPGMRISEPRVPTRPRLRRRVLLS